MRDALTLRSKGSAWEGSQAAADANDPGTGGGAGRALPHGGGHERGGGEGGLESCNMGCQTMERDLSGVELCESSAKVALAAAGKANCDPAQALDASANALLAGRDRRADSSLGGSEARLAESQPVKSNNSVLRKSPR